MATELTPPRWDLSSVYPGLETDQFKADFAHLKLLVERMAKEFPARLYNLGVDTPPVELAEEIGQAIELLNDILCRATTMNAYIRSFVTTDSYNSIAKRLLSEFERLRVELEKQEVRFQSYIGSLAEVLPEVINQNGVVQAHAFMLRETAEQSQYLMSAVEEDLAAELSLSGANAWSKLQGTVTSQLKVSFELDGEIQELPTPALNNLHSHPDEDVRRRAYFKELEAWESVQEPLAAAMNGVKGTVVTLDRRRGRVDNLHSAIDAARIDRQTLDALLSAMKASFPQFRRYFRAKAGRFGQEQLPWWNLFAPVGTTTKSFTFPQARDFILDHFSAFTPELGDMANRAFANHWIDAEQRSGKRGGAFCMSVPAVKESRYFMQF